MEFDTDTFWRKEIYLPLLTNVTQNNPLQHNLVMTFMLSVHNQIQHYTESYCTDNRDTYKNKIIDLAEKTLSYVKNYGADEVIFNTQFIKGILINIISVYAHVFIYDKQFEKLKGIVMFIDSLNKILRFNENTPSFELICKLKGDFWLFNSVKDINASLSFYDKALKKLNNCHPKKPIILFNMGYCHFLNNDKKRAIDCLSRCISEFNNIEQNRGPFDFYYRPDCMNKKLKIAKKIINLIEIN